ncbi:MAG: hypothetical protein ACRDV9_13155 [Acidimicrobiia bacterium]
MAPTRVAGPSRRTDVPPAEAVNHLGRRSGGAWAEHLCDLRLPGDARVLDCAAGIGQLAVGLALQGFGVVVLTLPRAWSSARSAWLPSGGSR